jgi:hypothetical protein
MTINGYLRTCGLGRVPSLKGFGNPTTVLGNSWTFRGFLQRWSNYRYNKVNAT